MSKLKLSVIIPAYNEAKNLKKGVLDKVAEYLGKQSYPYEVVVVDDGSVDETASLIKEEIKNKKNFRLIENPHGGKAITVMTGILESVGEIAVFSDMDQSTPLKEIERFFLKFDEGYDVVVGERSGREGAPLIRKIYAWGFSILRSIILGFSFDTQCGFKAFNRKAVEEVFPALLKRWQYNKAQGAAVNAGFDIELLFLSRKKNLKVAGVPVEWHYVGTQRVGMRAATEALQDILRIRFNDLTGKYAKSN